MEIKESKLIPYKIRYIIKKICLKNTILFTLQQI